MGISIYLFLCLFTYVYECLTLSVLFLDTPLWQEVPQSPCLWEWRLDSDLGLANQQLSLQMTLYLGQRTQKAKISLQFIHSDIVLEQNVPTAWLLGTHPFVHYFQN